MNKMNIDGGNGEFGMHAKLWVNVCDGDVNMGIFEESWVMLSNCG
jgi:hypothetical protein